jgi:hypothetical protein
MDGDPNGFVFAADHANLENDVAFDQPSLAMSPAAFADGFIQGTYPEYTARMGDHFQAIVGCRNGYVGCSVLFRLAYIDSTGALHDLSSTGEFYDGSYSRLDVDLSPLAGRKVKLVLIVSSLDNASGDYAAWVGPRIVHFLPPTMTAVPTSTIAPMDTPASPSSTPTSAAATATATPPASGDTSQPSIFEQFIQSIVTFFKNLFGG